MRDLEKKPKPNENDDFYQEIAREERGDHTTSCITLIIFCMIVYATLIFTFWKISPWFWRVTDRAADIRNNIKIPSSNQSLEDMKNKAKNTLNKTKENIENQATNKLEGETNSAVNSAKDQAENAVNNQINSVNNDLNKPK